jgi:hypothetical protein
MIEGADGRLWIGSYSGLTLFTDGKFKVFTERDGLPSKSANASPPSCTTAWARTC